MKRIFSAIAVLMLSCTLFAQDEMMGNWTGKLQIGSSQLTIGINLSNGADGALICTLDSPDQGAKGIKAEATVEGIVLKVTIPAIGADYKGILYNGEIKGRFTQSGVALPLDLKKGNEVLNRPQNPVGPFPYSSEEVEFVNGDAVLCGSLVIPNGAGKDTPVVLMITGSGLENRDEEIFEHKPFLVIADFLARRGIASLRYDDRNFGASHGGDIKNATSLDFCQDAAAGVEFLRKRFSRVGALGHSEGGSIVYMLGATGKIDFAISLAGIGVKGDQALLAQANRVLELNGIDEKYDLPRYRAIVASQNSPWLSWFIDYDPSADIAGCKCPVFAVNGDKDIQVISSVNLVPMGKLLSGRPVSDKDFVKEYPGLNHLFQHCKTGDVSEYRQIEETISTELLEDLAGWLSKNFLKK